MVKQQELLNRQQKMHSLPLLSSRENEHTPLFLLFFSLLTLKLFSRLSELNQKKLSEVVQVEVSLLALVLAVFLVLVLASITLDSMELVFLWFALLAFVVVPVTLALMAQ